MSGFNLWEKKINKQNEIGKRKIEAEKDRIERLMERDRNIGRKTRDRVLELTW